MTWTNVDGAIEYRLMVERSSDRRLLWWGTSAGTFIPDAGSATVTTKLSKDHVVRDPKHTQFVFLEAVDSNGHIYSSDEYHFYVVDPDMPEWGYAPEHDGEGSVIGMTITGYTGDEENLIVPTAFEDAAVTGIGNGAFYGNAALANIRLPATVNWIGNSAFENCAALRSVALPEGVSSIPSDTFKNCAALESLTVPNSVAYIAEDAFEGCGSLTVYAEPDSYAVQFCKDQGISYLYLSPGTIGNVRIAFQADRKYYKIGSEIQLSASIRGGVAPYQYNYVLVTNNHPTEVSDWVDDVTYSFSATEKGIAQVAVIVRDANGDIARSPILELTVNETGFNTPNGAIVSPDNGHAYYVFELDSVTTWKQARNYCRLRGGYLATINSAEENAFVYNSVVRASRYESAYFGLSDDNERGVWRWANGEKAEYTNWSYGEPNNEYGDEDYAMFFSGYTDGRWNDGSFEARTGNQGRAFICEWGEYTEDTTSVQTARNYSNWGKNTDTIRPVEYALLCSCCNNADDQSREGTLTDLRDRFYEQLTRFPEGHPLHVDNDPSKCQIGKDNIVVYREGNENAMDAVQIIIDSSHTIVVFAGTKDFLDCLQDALILMDANIFDMPVRTVASTLSLFDPDNLFSESQPEAANCVIGQIVAQGYEHIYVAGHSLGGHIAADVTLKNEAVEECFAFDPPGRGEGWFHNLLNGARAGLITNYLHVGSIVHMVGAQVGKTHSLNVEPDWSYPPLCWWHSIDKAYSALGGVDAIAKP